MTARAIRAESLCVMLIWLGVVAVWLWPATGIARAVLLTLVGLIGLACTWLLIVRVIRPRDEALDELLRAAGQTDPVTPDNLATRCAIAAGEIRSALSRAAALPAVRSSLANALAVFEGLAEPVLVLDRAGVVIASNTAAEEFFESKGLGGRTLNELLTQAEVLALHASALDGRPGMTQVRLQREGVRVYQVLTAPITLTSPAGSGATVLAGPGVILTLRDVTELALAVQLKTDFVANASHELRTPLAAIKGAAETLSDGALDDRAMGERLTRMISENAARLEDLVHDLLDLSRLESPDAPVASAPVDLEEIVANLSRLFEGVCKSRRVTIVPAIAEGARHIESDARLITLILKNLVENAAKFAYEGTAIRVEGEPTPDRGVRLRVIDSGQGIPIAQQARIFERFYQVDAARSGPAARRGTGLGLAIVKHAAKRLGGTIAVDSVWREGTTMTVEIPECLAPLGNPPSGPPHRAGA